MTAVDGDIADQQPCGRMYLGCPVWACGGWRGSLFTAAAPRFDWLKQYASVFSTAEGNSTFYGLPRPAVVRQWVDMTPRGFRFCLKFPRTITHERRLRDAERETAAFVELLDILDVGHRIGPSFLQLPPDFHPDLFDALEAYLRSLPTYLPWAVEVRHHDWYDKGLNEWRLDELLRELQMDKVLFDSRPLYSAPPGDEIEKISQSRKPKTPIRRTVTGRHPFLRIVGRNQLDKVTPWIGEWAPVIADWLKQGLDPFIFAHAPDDQYAPEFARRIHLAVKACLPQLPDPAVWPGEVQAASRRVQKTLFDD